MEITSRTRLVLLIGYPVDHSISPEIYNRIFDRMSIDARFLSLDVRPDRFERIFPALLDSGLRGNITAPFKEHAYRWVDIPSEEAILTGACNVFWSKDGITYGDNTDIRGFVDGLPPRFRQGIKGSSAVVLGAGGAARSVAAGLLREGMEGIVILNRNEARARNLVNFLSGVFPDHAVRYRRYGALEDIRGGIYPYLVNATSCGWKAGEKPPIDPREIPGLRYFCDVIYRGETELMRHCRSLDVEVVGGLEMLVHQGALSLKRWFDIEAPVDLMREIALLSRERIRSDDDPDD